MGKQKRVSYLFGHPLFCCFTKKNIILSNQFFQKNIGVAMTGARHRHFQPDSDRVDWEPRSAHECL